MQNDEIRAESMNDELPSDETGTEEEVPASPSSEDVPAEEEGNKGKKKKEETISELKKRAAALKEENEKYEAELVALKDKYARLLAEYDNYRKRSAKEREGVYTEAVADVVVQMIPIADTLALASSFGEGDAEKVAEGLSLTAKTFAELLAKFGVESFGEVGDTFDPTIHNAVMHEEDETKGEGEITAIFQRGYRRGDKIIRYAMVKTAN